MAATSQSGQSRRGSSRGRTQAKRAGGSTSRSTSKNGTSGSGSASKNGTSKSPASKSRSGGSTAAKRASSSTKSATSQASSTASNSNGNHNGQHEALTNLGVSVFSAAVGAVGGALLTRKARQPRKVLGIPVPEKVDLGGVADQIGAAGKQFGQLAGEVKAVREKAEQIGRLLS